MGLWLRKCETALGVRQQQQKDGATVTSREQRHQDWGQGSFQKLCDFGGSSPVLFRGVYVPPAQVFHS